MSASPEKEGYSVTYLTPGSEWFIVSRYIHGGIADDTILVSIMQVNNETGVIQILQR